MGTCKGESTELCTALLLKQQLLPPHALGYALVQGKNRNRVRPGFQGHQALSNHLQEVVEVVGPALALSRQPGDAGAERLPLGVVQVDARQLPRPIVSRPCKSVTR